MDHVVILNKKWGMLPKILDGRKTVESRWYKRAKCPFDCVKSGDALYFKDSGEEIFVRGEVEKVLQFDNLNPKLVRELLEKYGYKIGIEKDQISYYFDQFKGKKYALLVFLSDVKKVMPFDIDKSKAGYCSRAAWITISDIESIKK